MANIQSIDMKNDKIFVNLILDKEEYKILGNSTRHLLLLPSDSKDLTELLTTGKLGNSNRVMLPNKVLKKNDVTNMLKKVPARLFDVNDEKFLLLKLQESKIAKPFFGDEE